MSLLFLLAVVGRKGMSVGIVASSDAEMVCKRSRVVADNKYNDAGLVVLCHSMLVEIALDKTFNAPEL